jgi:hypothetical protein
MTTKHQGKRPFCSLQLPAALTQLFNKPNSQNRHYSAQLPSPLKDARLILYDITLILTLVGKHSLDILPGFSGKSDT